MTSIVHTTLLVPGPSQLNVSRHSEAAPTPVVSARPGLDAGVPSVAGPVVQTTEAAPAAAKTGKKVGSKGKARADRDDTAEPEAPRARTRAMLRNAATK